MMTQLKVILADDSALLREGLAGLLERMGHQIQAHASSAPELVKAVEEAAAADDLPDIIITDVRMPPEMTDDGLRAAVQIRGAHPDLAIMVLSQYVAPAYAKTLFDAGGGGTGYLLKDRVARVADFIQSLQMVATGGVVVDPEVAASLIRSKGSALTSLTPREREVLEAMARGLSNSQIAKELFLSGAAISKHVANVFMKLGLSPDQENRRVRAVLTYLTETQP